MRLVFLFALAAGAAHAGEPTIGGPSWPKAVSAVLAWTSSKTSFERYRVERQSPHDETEEHFFGARSVMRWKVTRPMPGEPQRTQKRLFILMAEYADETAAARRMQRFHEMPTGLSPEAQKAYPLRAGFQLNEQVVIVTTDVYAWEQDAYAAAKRIAELAHATSLTCWMKCPD